MGVDIVEVWGIVIGSSIPWIVGQNGLCISAGRQAVGVKQEVSVRTHSCLLCLAIVVKGATAVHRHLQMADAGLVSHGQVLPLRADARASLDEVAGPDEQPLEMGNLDIDDSILYYDARSGLPCLKSWTYLTVPLTGDVTGMACKNE